jgi:alanine racemase
MSRYQARAHIDLDAVAKNFSLAKQLAPASQVMAIVKANAYGHGAIEVARNLTEADVFGVARISEAVKLREAGIAKPICLLEGVMDKEELNLSSIYDFQMVLHSSEQLELLKAQGARRAVWLKIDTGMGRLGISPQEAENYLQHLGAQRLLGLMTHLANASQPDDPATGRQIALIRETSSSLTAACPGAGVLSIANSAGVLTRQGSDADWIRPGLMLYGASPMDDLEVREDLHPAMTFRAPVIAVKKIKQGESVGYGGTWTAARDTRVAVVAAGYADGYPREIEPGTPVLVNGERRSIIGRVSMDMLCVELLGHDHVEVADQVILWGSGLPVEEIARSAGTIAYTLLCGVSQRVPREYRGKDKKVG